MKSIVPAIALVSAAILAPGAAAFAHFVLVSPTPTLEQNQLGDPQKKAPCGGTTANPGVATNAVTEVRGGDMLHIKISETVYHPGHYRIALAVKDIAELPADPVTTTREGPRGPISVSAVIHPNPKAPVLVDGLFAHVERMPAGGFHETDVKIPNINCNSCTIQVIQWMAEHGLNADGDYSYHHCATLKVTANPALPIDRAWPGQ